MNTTPKTARDWRYVLARVLVSLFLVYAAANSFAHIREFALMIGLTDQQAWSAPFFVDGIAAMGLLGRHHSFSAEARRGAIYLIAFGGVLSITANVGAGHGIGQRGWGALTVLAFGLVEWFASTKLAPAKPAPVEAPVVTDEVKARRSASATKGAATRKRNAAAAKKQERAATRAARTPKAPADTDEARRMLAAAGAAPVSPAYGS